jgi:mannose-1-phosphate guanylyltransferase
MNTAFLLAAGLGTRLRPLTLFRPKPLLPLCGASLLDHALAHLRAHGHERVLVNAHHLWEQVAAWAAANGAELQVELPTILGTGGGLKAAAPRLAPRFVIVNGDVLSDVDLAALLDAVPPGGAAMALRPAPEAAQIGPVEMDEEGVVVRITSVVPGQGIAGTHFTGVHAMDRDTLQRVPEGEQCIVRTAYKALVPQRKVAGRLHRGAWVDIGTPGAYWAANLDVLAGRLPTPLDPWTRGARGPGGSFVGAGARVYGELEQSIVGAGTIVEAGARLRRAVVWDGLTVPPGDYEDCVIFGEGEVLAIDPRALGGGAG